MIQSTSTNSNALSGDMSNPPLEVQETNSDSKDNEIKTYVQTLTPLHLESSLKLEELAFPPEERGSRSKVRTGVITLLLQLMCASLNIVSLPAASYALDCSPAQILVLPLATV